MNYYIYFHRRHDTNNIFYVGVGTKPKNTKSNFKKVIYARAYSTRGRNFIWKKISKITSYNVEIYAEFDSIKQAKLVETNFIKFYGRIIKNTGTLANIIESDEEIQMKQKEILKIKSEKSRIKTFKYSLDGIFLEEYNSILEASIKNNIPYSTIDFCIKGKRKKGGLFLWKDFKKDTITKYSSHRKAKPVHQYDLNNNYIKTWNSIAEVGDYYNINTSKIRSCLCGKSKTSINYKWKF